MKNILYVASEAVPFIKTGGLADVVGSLPKYFNKEEIDVRVMLPKYMCMKEKWRDNLEYVTHFYMDFNGKRDYVGILKYVNDGITFYFIDNEYYFHRGNLYGSYDDAERFAFFSRAILEMLPYIDFHPDIIHTNDWQTALVPTYYYCFYSKMPWYQNIKSMFTIHNIQLPFLLSSHYFSSLI